ncbi:MAG: radical SAM protein [Candidatus Omnitrophica bacterium]|nr:radical SAM protein [Candidatus Omnitrophota bacterium]
MSLIPERILRRPNIHTAFIYLTEKCSLKCAYCYFKKKKDRDNSLKSVESFLDFLIKYEFFPQKFEISGGEPLLRWENLKAVVQTIEKRFLQKSVSIQTNGLFLTKDKVRFIKKHRVFLEIGIDGDSATTMQWRKGINSRSFSQLIHNIQHCVKEGVPVGCNMTVHPKAAGQLVQNFSFLMLLGVSHVDVTPAAFMRWDERARTVFKEQYDQLMKLHTGWKRIYMGEDREFIADSLMDISFHPSGHVLCGDAYLCLPEKQKQKYSLWNHQTACLRPEVMNFFMGAYRTLRSKLGKRPYTHRDYVCSSFQIVNELVGGEYLNTNEIIPLMLFLTRTHLKAMRP